MDSLLTSAARSLEVGDPLGALKRVALRDDPPALALRGIAMAQLGEYERARLLLRRAARGFGPRELAERARCQAAEAELALAARDLRWPVATLASVASTLDRLGERTNALNTRLVIVRRQLLLGRLDDAEQQLCSLETRGAPAALVAIAELAHAEIALRRLQTLRASEALGRAREAALGAAIPSLVAEVERATRALTMPAARLVRAGEERTVRLDEVEAVCSSDELVIDACRRVIRGRFHVVTLARRPVLFALARLLAEAWPAEVPRERLAMGAFEVRAVNSSHRARLRVEMGRLRAALRPIAAIEATSEGFRLVPRAAPAVVVLAPPIDGPAGAILALLEGGEGWSTSALATALGASQRTVQRALRGLEQAATVRSVGRGRSQRWLARSLTGFATTLLLPGALPLG